MENAMNTKSFFTVLLCTLSLCFLSSCSGSDETVPALNCPFTEMSWSSTTEDILAAEGADYAAYDSVYGGICYTYPKVFEGYEGTVKYMFNENDKLMCVAWAYNGTDDEESLFSLYNIINDSVIDMYGESGYDGNGVGNYGNVWYLESGDIVLTTMLTSDNKALQYAYLHPSVSNTAEKEN